MQDKLKTIIAYRLQHMRTIFHDHDYQIILDTEDYSLHIEYNTVSDHEISCQVYHPKGGTFVCIEPLSATFPPNPKLNRSSLEAKIEIFSPLHPNND